LFLFDPSTMRRLGEHGGLVTRRLTTGSSTEILRESRHYAVTQGRVLPADLAARTATVERSWAEPRRSRLFDHLVAPLAVAARLVGRGDVMEVEFAAAAA
jgi:hypothetical protein